MLAIVIALQVIWNFNNFDLIWATTEGGPVNATTTLTVHVYRTAFKSLDLGYAAAIGVVMLVALLLFSIFYVQGDGGRRGAMSGTRTRRSAGRRKQFVSLGFCYSCSSYSSCRSTGY